MIKKKKAPAVRKRTEKISLKPIQEIARSLGIKQEFLENQGPYRAKISLGILNAKNKTKNSKYVLVTSVTPMPFGEGKTVTSIGLSMAFNKLKKKSIACIAQPALGGIIGLKGAGTGSGMAQVFPKEDANLHLAGDTHAVESANNLCAAYLDNSIFKGNPLDIDPESIIWRRVIDANDRSLRYINTGLGSKADGISRKTGFDVTAASELTAILTLAGNLKDLRRRIGNIIVGFTKKGKPLTCEDLKIAGAMTVLLKDAVKPNLLQTKEQTPCFVHGASFGNVSVGSSSVVADKIALKLSDYVVAETGFGADMGAEKFFDIKCRQSAIKPNAAVLVCTVRGFKMHSGDFDIVPGKPLPRDILRENVFSVEKGLSNLEKQAENLQTFGIPFVVCVNRFSEDTEKEVNAIKKRAINVGASGVAVSQARALGGEGGIELAKAVTEACKAKSSFRFLYPLDIPIKDKIKRIAKTIYGARDVKFSEEANAKALLFKKLKLDNLPICMVKTHLSLSHSPKRKGRPHGFRLPVEDMEVRNGAGYITVFCGNVKTMPGLPKNPRAARIDIDAEGNITGLF